LGKLEKVAERTCTRGFFPTQKDGEDKQKKNKSAPRFPQKKRTKGRGPDLDKTC